MVASQALAALIEGWVAKNRHNNLNVLHQRSGISYTTVTRLAQAKIEAPQLEAVFSILPIVASDAERIAFLNEHYPSIMKVVERADIDKGTEEKPVISNQVFDELFRDPITFRFCQHLLSRSGISTGKVKELFGEAGMDLIKDLENQSLISHSGGVWRTSFDYSNGSVEGNVAQAVSAAKGFKVEGINASAAMLYNLSETVSLTAAQEMVKEFQECLNRVRKIRDENPGPHLFIASTNFYLADPQAAIDEEASK